MYVTKTMTDNKLKRNSYDAHNYKLKHIRLSHIFKLKPICLLYNAHIYKLKLIFALI